MVEFDIPAHNISSRFNYIDVHYIEIVLTMADEEDRSVLHDLARLLDEGCRAQFGCCPKG